MQALVQRHPPSSPSPTLSLESLPLPSPAPHQALISITHTAQNPTDIQSLDASAFGPGSILGCDFSGTVLQPGSAVTRVQPGDRIAGLIWGGEIPSLGAYATHTLADERICFRIPAALGSADAATVPLAATTAWLALFSEGCLAIPRAEFASSGALPSPPPTVLIWGAASSVGMFAVQLARAQGLRVVATCSPRNFSRVRDLGAERVFDYREEGVGEKIRAEEGEVRYAFDTIGNEGSSGLASGALKEGGTLCTVRPGRANTGDVRAGTKVVDVLVWTAFLKEHRYGEFKWPVSFVFSVSGFSLIEVLARGDWWMGSDVHGGECGP